MTKLREKLAQDGTRLDQRLDALLEDLRQMEPSAPELYVHLRDLHDGALRVVNCISELAELDASNLERINRLLWDIQVELYDHLVPNHLGEMKPILVELCNKLSDEVHAADDEE